MTTPEAIARTDHMAQRTSPIVLFARSIPTDVSWERWMDLMMVFATEECNARKRLSCLREAD